MLRALEARMFSGSRPFALNNVSTDGTFFFFSEPPVYIQSFVVKFGYTL